jgi:hypothetical protein
MGAGLAVCLSASRVSIDGGSVHGSADLELCGLALQDLIRSGQLTASGQLPPVLPLVLYNGVRRWQAPEEMAELVATVPGGLERYRPCLRYFLLDEGRFTEDDLAPLRNLAAALFRLEEAGHQRMYSGATGVD